MINDSETNRKDILRKIKKAEICFAGNSPMKIYGVLNCSNGKRMKTSNRVFFSSQQEAIDNNYRPCGHCMNVLYKQWKQSQY